MSVEAAAVEPRVRVPANERSARAAAAAFVVVEVVALLVFLRAGRHQWFLNDEWSFLSGRELTNVDDLLRPHWGHWVTIPVVIYRGLFGVFGLRTYLPYQLVAIASHLGVAALMRVVMRRAGVGPWVATVAAGSLAMFGSGQENVIWAFQITFTGALLFGLVHLLLADHGGTMDRRDWLGLLAGVAALMFSVVGVVMVFVVGLAVLLRRGWRIAMVHTVPLLGLFALWIVVWGERSPEVASGLPSMRVLAIFVANLISGAFEAMGQVRGVGLSLAVLMGLGAVTWWRGQRHGDWTAAVAASLSVFAGALLFVALTGMARSGYYGTERAYESRYLYMVAAMTLPCLAFCAQALMRQWPKTTPVLVVLLLIGVPGNIRAADDRGPLFWGQRDLVIAMAWSPALPAVPADQGVLPGVLTPTAGFLREGAEKGRIPRPERSDPPRTAAAVKLLLFREDPGASIQDKICRGVVGLLSEQLDNGDVLRLGDRDLDVHVTVDSHAQDLTLSPGRIVILANGLVLTTDHPVMNPPIEVCR